MKSILAHAIGLFLLAASPVMAVETNPVYHDPGIGLYFKDKGKPVPIETAGGGESIPGPQGPQGEPGVAGPKGDKGDTGPAGRDGVDGVAGVDGKDGRDGVDGRDGRDGIGFSYANDLAASVGIGGIELRQGGKGVTSWSAGIGAIKTGGGTSKAIAIGLHHGISDNWGVYGKLSRSIGGGKSSTAAFVGVEGQF